MTCADDVLEVFGLTRPRQTDASLGPPAEALLARLRESALTADELVRVSGIAPGKASAALAELEIAGLVALEDGVYRASL